LPIPISAFHVIQSADSGMHFCPQNPLIFFSNKLSAKMKKAISLLQLIATCDIPLS